MSTSDLAFLQYTGGTTGVAKAAMLSHGNLIANILQCTAWVSPFLYANPRRMITALPLYHIFSLTVNLFCFFYLGGCNVLVPNARDLTGLLRLMRKKPFTALTGVNTLFKKLLQHPDFSKVDFSPCDAIIAGGMALQTSVAEEWQQRTGKVIIEGYGLTETSPVVCVNRLNEPRHTGTIGLPIPGTEIAVVDDNDAFLPPNTPGEFCVRGPQVMIGYWERPDENQKVFLPGGWVRSGDIAIMDEKGFTRIVDRKKELILVSGFNVYPSEVENVLMEHPRIIEAAVVGIPDLNSTEVPKAYVVRNDIRLTEEEVRAYCEQKLSRYKVPKEVVFIDEIPKSPVGKILRRLLRDSV